MFIPYRFDEEFAKLCHEYGVNSLGIHATHPGELVEVVKEKIALLRRASPYTALFLNTPLLAGVNDTVETMKELLVKARTFGIEPRYVYHTMPETPNGTLFHVPIVQAIEFMKSFSMNIASTIRPRFVIVPEEGKFEPSLYGIPNYEIIDNGTGITYKNRKEEEMIYRDPL